MRKGVYALGRQISTNDLESDRHLRKLMLDDLELNILGCEHFFVESWQDV